MNPDFSAQPRRKTHALHILLASLIDYAGLFPPAGLEMKRAVENYARFHESPEAWMLGRFIVPVSRLSEFEAVLPIARHGQGWHVSALAGTNLEADVKAIAAFNQRHSGMVTIDSIETKVTSPDEIENLRKVIPDWLLTYFEIPSDCDLRRMIATAFAVRARAKVRTGGLKPDAIPPSLHVVSFIQACVEAGVPFKATAGLHHPVRCVRPLTYEADALTGNMHGFLNVFMAAAFALAGMPEPLLIELLEDASPRSFVFDANGARWREQHIDNTHLLECRASLGMSFGSCSFEEPIEDLRAMNLL
jgi:hypothetical protein